MWIKILGLNIGLVCNTILYHIINSIEKSVNHTFSQSNLAVSAARRMAMENSTFNLRGRRD